MVTPPQDYSTPTYRNLAPRQDVTNAHYSWFQLHLNIPCCVNVYVKFMVWKVWCITLQFMGHTNHKFPCIHNTECMFKHSWNQLCQWNFLVTTDGLLQHPLTTHQYAHQLTSHPPPALPGVLVWGTRDDTPCHTRHTTPVSLDCPSLRTHNRHSVDTSGEGCPDTPHTRAQLESRHGGRCFLMLRGHVSWSRGHVTHSHGHVSWTPSAPHGHVSWSRGHVTHSRDHVANPRGHVTCSHGLVTQSPHSHLIHFLSSSHTHHQVACDHVCLVTLSHSLHYWRGPVPKRKRSGVP